MVDRQERATEAELERQEKDELHNLKKDFSQKEPEKIYLLKRFLDWIARGTEKSGTGKPFCPT